jgi:hypothetical protein
LRFGRSNTLAPAGPFDLCTERLHPEHRRALRCSLVRIRLCVVVGALVSVAGAAAAVSHAAVIPAWSYVPPPLRARLVAKEGGTLFLPARTPLFYRYRSGAVVANGKLSVTFTNRVRIRQGLWKWTNTSFLWEVLPVASPTACARRAAVSRTFQVDGNRVYWTDGADGGSAWRCVVDRHGRSHVLVASRGGKLGGVALAIVVASGLDVSDRTSPVAASLAVTPSTVRRGRSVLLRGAAGGCPSGDTVAVLSRAFAGARSFAGVPAVFARVGVDGRFSARARVPLTRRPGAYVLTARCGGGNLGVSAHLHVTR